jgi:hypothetical protein
MPVTGTEMCRGVFAAESVIAQVRHQLGPSHQALHAHVPEVRGADAPHRHTSNADRPRVSTQIRSSSCVCREFSSGPPTWDFCKPCLRATITWEIKGYSVEVTVDSLRSVPGGGGCVDSPLTDWLTPAFSRAGKGDTE